MFAAQTDLLLPAQSSLVTPKLGQRFLPLFDFEKPQRPTALGFPSIQSSDSMPSPLLGHEETWIQDDNPPDQTQSAGPADYENNMPATFETNFTLHSPFKMIRSKSCQPYLLLNDEKEPQGFIRVGSSNDMAAEAAPGSIEQLVDIGQQTVGKDSQPLNR